MAYKVERLVYTVLCTLAFPFVLWFMGTMMTLGGPGACEPVCDEMLIGISWVAMPVGLLFGWNTYHRGILFNLAGHAGSRLQTAIASGVIAAAFVVYVGVGLTLIGEPTSEERWFGLWVGFTLFAGTIFAIIGWLIPPEDISTQ